MNKNGSILSLKTNKKKIFKKTFFGGHPHKPFVVVSLGHILTNKRTGYIVGMLQKSADGHIAVAILKQELGH